MSYREKRSPGALGRSLPYVYLAAGLLSPLVLQNRWAIGSGVLFFLAGVALLWKRTTHRKAHRSGLIDATRGASGAKQLVWSRALESGNTAIDEQHKNLIRAGNTLLDAVHTSRSQAHVKFSVDCLIDEVKAHFKSEEALLAAWNHPITDEHRAQHEDLLDKAMALARRSQNSRLSNRHVLDFLVDDLVYGHIATQDRKFFYEI